VGGLAGKRRGPARRARGTARARRGEGLDYSGIANLRTTLFLTPKALRAAGVRLEGETPAALPMGDTEDEDALDLSDEAFQAQVAELRARGEL
jgi:hypothetical protein